MRVLADENIPKPIVDLLQRNGSDVSWIRLRLPGDGDANLLEIAESESRLLLTLDKDFLQIALQRREPLRRSGVVLFRVHPATPERLVPLAEAFLESSHSWVGNVSVLTPTGIQMMPSR